MSFHCTIPGLKRINGRLRRRRNTRDTESQQRAQTMQRIVEEIATINNALESSTQSWRSVLPNARDVIRLLDGPPSLAEVFDIDYQIHTAYVLQRLAYKEPDHQPEVDIASWCERRWATIMQNFSHDFRPSQGTLMFFSENTLKALRQSHLSQPYLIYQRFAYYEFHDSRILTLVLGLGEAWLLKAQETLARIARDEGSVSSDGSYHSTTSRGNGSLDIARLNLPDYVQARDLLRPSLDLFDRAIELAGGQGELSGRLLTLVSRNTKGGNITVC